MMTPGSLYCYIGSGLVFQTGPLPMLLRLKPHQNGENNQVQHLVHNDHPWRPA